MKLAKKLVMGTLEAFQLGPLNRGDPKPMWYAHSTHTMRTVANPANVMRIVLTTHFFCTRPPKRTARPGTLMSATKVAAVICHALSPVFRYALSEKLGAAAACRFSSRCCK